MDRQTILAFVMIGIVLMVWMYISSPPPQKVQPKKTAAVKVDTNKTVPRPDTQAVIETPKVKIVEDTTGAAKIFPRMKTAETIFTIDNDVARFELTSRGGKIKRIFLKHYNNWFAANGAKQKEPTDRWVELIDTKRDSSTALIFITNDGKKICTGDLEFVSAFNESQRTIKGNDSARIEFLYKTSDNRIIKKTFTFFGDRYDTRLDLEMTGFQDLIDDQKVDLVWGAGIRFVEENSVDEASSADASIYAGEIHDVIDAPSDYKLIEKRTTGTADWVALRTKYFVSILAPASPADVAENYVRGYSEPIENNGLREHYYASLTLSMKDGAYKNSFLMYNGPASYPILRSYDKHFDKIVDFGSFFGLKFIVRPIAEYVLLPLFNFLHIFIPNYGIVIILFSIILKILLQPLTKKSNTSMQKMQLLQPKIAELKEKMKDDPTKLNKETMKLYSTYGVNPMGGCLPMLLQMPIFIAFWGLFRNAVELRQQPFFWWINDLSRPDIVATLPFKIPLFGVDQISVLALLMGITMFIQQKMTVKDPSQKAMVYLMPIMLTFLFMSFPSGLNLYYFMFNLLSIGQQYYLTHHTKGIVLEPVKKAQKKGFMERMMEAAEQKAQDQSRGKRKK